MCIDKVKRIDSILMNIQEVQMEDHKKMSFLFIGGHYDRIQGLVNDFKHSNSQVIAYVLVHPQSDQLVEFEVNDNPSIKLIEVDYKSDEEALIKALYGIRSLDAVTSINEDGMKYFASMIPLFKKKFPNLLLPEPAALLAAADKNTMRDKFNTFDENISPRSVKITDLQRWRNYLDVDLNFPIIVKPANSSASTMVSRCESPGELEDYLRDTVPKLNDYYSAKKGAYKPAVIIEEFIDGPLHSIDSYVTNSGEILHCPVVDYFSRVNVGMEGFGAYAGVIPSKLSKSEIVDAEALTGKAIEALGLRNTSCHTELVKSKAGWKVIEVGARIGGSRDEIYKIGFNFNHLENDLLNRCGLPVSIKTEPVNSSAYVVLFANSRGKLVAIEGLEEFTTKSSSKITYTQRKQIDDTVDTSFNGGKRILHLFFSNSDSSKLLTDVMLARKQISFIID